VGSGAARVRRTRQRVCTYRPRSFELVEPTRVLTRALGLFLELPVLTVDLLFEIVQIGYRIADLQKAHRLHNRPTESLPRDFMVMSGNVFNGSSQIRILLGQRVSWTHRVAFRSGLSH